jgi:hypothetical protein
VAHRGGWASGAAGRDRPDGVPTAKGGRTAAGEASHYPAVLRAGGRGEVEPQWGKRERRVHGGSSHLGEGTTSMVCPNPRWGRRSEGGGGRKSDGEEFCPWGPAE